MIHLYCVAENGERRKENEAVQRAELSDRHDSFISRSGEWRMENEAIQRAELYDRRDSFISRSGEWRKEKGERRMKLFSEQNPMVGVIHLYREAENGE